MEYRERVTDKVLERRLKAFGAVLVTGPKGCGKTTSAKRFSKSFVEFQDEDRREAYLSVADVQPSILLEGEKPRLFDEWQDAPKIWGAIRKSVDDTGGKGMYILTGSTSRPVDTPHSGTMRISTMKMMPMSLFESGESNGEVSLKSLFDDPQGYRGCVSDLSMESLIHAICRGGWPGSLGFEDESLGLEISKDYFRQICNVDASSVDGIRRNPRLVEAVIRSYSRNICTLADRKTIMDDVRSVEDVSESTYYNYVQALERLFVIEDVDAWSPSIRSKGAVRAGKKRNMSDPSLAVVALGLSPGYFREDFKTLGFLFESLVIRDLKAYSCASGGAVSYYHDRYGLESDAVLHLEDGRYALCEVKLGSKEIDKGAENLLKIESLIRKRNEDGPRIRPPDLKMVITGTEHGYRRDDGVLVVPVGCLRDRRFSRTCRRRPLCA